MINNTVAFSRNIDGMEAFKEVKEQISKGGAGKKPILLIYSSAFEMFASFTRMLSREYPDATAIGTTSFINYSNIGYSLDAISVMAVFDGVECAGGVITEASTYPMRHVGEIDAAVKKIHSSENTICLEYTTSFASCEEIVQDTYRSVLAPKQIQLFGGTSGAAENLKTTRVAFNGEIFNDASVFVLIHNIEGKIHLYKENIFKPTKHVLIATDVDVDERAVYEYNNQPAIEAVSEALKIPVEEISKKAYLHPVGRINGEDVFITETAEIFPNGKITYFARIYGQSKLALLELDDVRRVWNETAENVKKLSPNPSMVLAVNCFVRSQMFLEEKMFDDFVEKLKKEYGNFIGVSGYGEQLNFEHLNQTMLLAVFD